MYVYQGKEKERRCSRPRPRTRLRGEVYMKPISTATLKKRREREGYSQRQLALLCKCTQAAISALECGDHDAMLGRPGKPNRQVATPRRRRTLHPQ